MSETWHERFMRLGAAKDYAGCLEMLRAPAASPAIGSSHRLDEISDASPPPHHAQLGLGTEGGRAELAERLLGYADAYEATRGSHMSELQKLLVEAAAALSSSPPVGGNQEDSVSVARDADAPRFAAATEAQRKSEGGEP
jgi:hypothetical protein